MRQGMAGSWKAGLAGLLMLAAPAGVSAQTAMVTYVDVAWRSIPPEVCQARSREAINAAITAFGIVGARVEAETWFVLGHTDTLSAWIMCVADDNTAALDIPTAKRVLVTVTVSAIGGAVGAQMRSYLAECMAGACPAAVDPAPLRITWSTAAEGLRGRNGERFSFACPSLGAGMMAFIWGTDTYTDDSPICVAAVHAGAMTVAGGVVLIEIAPGLPAYVGTERNGVISADWPAFDGSYRFVLRPAP